jgi:hypothetical protein
MHKGQGGCAKILPRAAGLLYVWFLLLRRNVKDLLRECGIEISAGSTFGGVSRGRPLRQSDLAGAVLGWARFAPPVVVKKISVGIGLVM